VGAGPRQAQTRTDVHVLTPEYGSPEQARGELITVATDVYSLGAVLHELLTGARAHRFASESMVVMLQTICELDPRRPSEVAPAGRRRALAGDLDNIVLKAMQKLPAHRYDSVAELQARPAERVGQSPIWV
jgi:serine/threonine protein kinase